MEKATFFEIEELFAPIETTVTSFAKENGLRLKRCARGNSGWELVRDRNEGGQIFLLLMYDRTLGLGVGSVWVFTSDEMSLQYSHFRPMTPCNIEQEAVGRMLRIELDAIMNVKFGYWTHIMRSDKPDVD